MRLDLKIELGVADTVLLELFMMPLYSDFDRIFCFLAQMF